MIGADPIERVSRAIARDEDMSHFGMARSVDWATVDDCAPSNASADCDVDQAIETAPGSPAMFPEGGSVHIGVEHDRQLQFRMYRANHVGVSPARLGCGGDVSVRRGAGPQIKWAERADADGRQGRRSVMSEQEIRNLGQSLGRGGGRDPHAVANVVRPQAHGAVDLAATRLDCAKEHVSKDCVLLVGYVQLGVSIQTGLRPLLG